MRYQEKISSSGICVRNRDNLNVSMSSDVCIFSAPFFEMSGATKIETGTTSASTGVYIVEDEENIDLTFDFSYGSGSLDANSIFKFEIYKLKVSKFLFLKKI